MKTIAVTIDEPSLAAIDQLARATGRRAPGKRANRSELVRRAIREFLARQRRQHREERDRVILAAHRETLRRQAEKLVAGQAEP
jgi:metal-responsive CopG/Arc/MetJ family transcriptional regulator